MQLQIEIPLQITIDIRNKKIPIQELTSALKGFEAAILGKVLEKIDSVLISSMQKGYGKNEYPQTQQGEEDDCNTTALFQRMEQSSMPKVEKLEVKVIAGRGVIVGVKSYKEMRERHEIGAVVVGDADRDLSALSSSALFKWLIFSSSRLQKQFYILLRLYCSCNMNKIPCRHHNCTRFKITFLFQSFILS